MRCGRSKAAHVDRSRRRAHRCRRARARAGRAASRLTASIEPRRWRGRSTRCCRPTSASSSAEDAPTDFHARFSATGKIYDYRIVNAPFASPFLRRYVWHVHADARPRRDARGGRARSSARTTSRRSRAPGPSVRTTVRTITAARLERRRRVRRSAGDADRRGRLPAPHGPQHRRHAGRDRAAAAGRPPTSTDDPGVRATVARAGHDGAGRAGSFLRRSACIPHKIADA